MILLHGFAVFSLLDIRDSISSVITFNSNSNLPAFSKSVSEVLYHCRAKYVIDPVSGTSRLVNICSSPRPIFHSSGWELSSSADAPRDGSDIFDAGLYSCTPEENHARAVRRAKENAFDLVLCNDFTWFGTLTFSAEHIDRTDYSEAYSKIKVFFGNLVQRKGFAYLAVPEYHKDGQSIHFHLLCNGLGLDFVKSGHYRHGKPVYNIVNWKWGFSTALHVDGEDCRDKCAKYIFKYMGKQSGTKIGGRYFLSGGDLARPVYAYGDSPEDFTTDTPTYRRDTTTIVGLFTSLSFI